MEKRILVLTDFSKSSWNALQYGIALYTGKSCDFYILNVFSKDGHADGSPAFLDPEDTYNQMAEHISEDGLGDILNELSKNHMGTDHRFYALSKSGAFMEIVEQYIEDLQIDLVLMGAKGINNTDRDKYGKKTFQVIKNSKKCPVLIVPQKANRALPEKILFATDLNADISVSEMAHLSEIAKMGPAKIQVLGVTQGGRLTPRQEKNKNVVQSFFHGLDYSFNLLKNIRKSTALNCCVEIQHNDMISFIQPKTTFWETLGFERNELDKLGYYDNVPVLALNHS